MELKTVFGCGGVCWKNDNVGNWLFLLIPHSSVVFFLFVEAAKELRTEKKETKLLLISIFIFGVYDCFVAWNVFL